MKSYREPGVYSGEVDFPSGIINAVMSAQLSIAFSTCLASVTLPGNWSGFIPKIVTEPALLKV